MVLFPCNDASVVLLLAPYQVLCYCSLAKPDPHILWFHKIDMGLSSCMDKNTMTLIQPTILSRSRREKLGEGLASLLRHGPEMVDSVSTNRVYVT